MGGVGNNLIHHDQSLYVTIISLESKNLLTLLADFSEAEDKGQTLSEHY